MSMTPLIVDTETASMIRHYYVDKKMGQEDTARKFGHTSCWLTPRLKALSIPQRSYVEAQKEFECDETYFERIDSHEKALIFGFIIADGCIYQLPRPQTTPRLQISLQARDIEYLNYIKQCLKYTGPVRIHRANNGRDYCHIVVTNRKICDDLIKLGCHPRKSLVCLFPTLTQVPDEFLSSFVCGFFDGDGGYSVRGGKYVPNLAISFAISYDMALVLQSLIVNKLGVKSFLRKETRDKDKEPRTHIWRLQIGGNCQSLKLAEWMYSKVPFRMERKYQQFLPIRKQYDEHLNFIVPEEMSDGWRRSGQMHKGVKRSKETRLRLALSTNSPARRAQWTPVSLKSPDGSYYYSNNSNRFCRDELSKRGIVYGCLRQLARGKCLVYKKWTLATPEEIAQARQNGTLVEKVY